VELGEMMRAFSTEVDLMAYFGGGRFAILSPDRCGIVLHAALRRLADEIRMKAISRGMPVELQVQISAGELGEANGWQLDSLLDEVEEGLWENRPFEKTCETEAQAVLQ